MWLGFYDSSLLRIPPQPIYSQQTCLPSSISLVSCDYPDPGQASLPSSRSFVLSEFVPGHRRSLECTGGIMEEAVVVEQLLPVLTHHTTQDNLQRQEYSAYSALASTTMCHSARHSLLSFLFVGVCVKQVSICSPRWLGTQELPDSATQVLRLHFYSWPPWALWRRRYLRQVTKEFPR